MGGVKSAHRECHDQEVTMSKAQEAAKVLVLGLAPKNASTGSKGFYASEKVVIDGVRYQGQAAAWQIGSKTNPKATVTTPLPTMQAQFEALLATLSPKVLSGNKDGFYTCGKVVGNNNERYQSSITLTPIG